MPSSWRASCILLRHAVCRGRSSAPIRTRMINFVFNRVSPQHGNIFCSRTYRLDTSWQRYVYYFSASSARSLILSFGANYFLGCCRLTNGKDCVVFTPDKLHDDVLRQKHLLSGKAKRSRKKSKKRVLFADLRPRGRTSAALVALPYHEQNPSVGVWRAQ